MLVVGLLYILKPVDNKKKNCDDAVPIARLFMFTNLTRSLNVSNVFLSLAKNYEIWNEPHQYTVIKIRLCVSVPQLMPDYLMLLSHTHNFEQKCQRVKNCAYVATTHKTQQISSQHLAFKCRWEMKILLTFSLIRFILLLCISNSKWRSDDRNRLIFITKR